MITKLILTGLALLFVGSIADVPAMYLAVIGVIPLWFVFIVGFLADVLPDFFWYWLGYKLSPHLQNSWIFKRNPGRFEKVGKALDKYGGPILFGSKFVYAFGIPTQIMAGAHRFSLKRAFAANSFGSGIWLIVLYSMAHVFTSSEVAETYLNDVKIGFLLFILTSVVIYYFVGRKFKEIISSNGK